MELAGPWVEIQSQALQNTNDTGTLLYRLTTCTVTRGLWHWARQSIVALLLTDWHAVVQWLRHCATNRKVAG
jgi:hypothetical protein